jgi:hypothetical protein
MVAMFGLPLILVNITCSSSTLAANWYLMVMAWLLFEFF